MINVFFLSTQASYDIVNTDGFPSSVSRRTRTSGRRHSMIGGERYLFCILGLCGSYRALFDRTLSTLRARRKGEGTPFLSALL